MYNNDVCNKNTNMKNYLKNIFSLNQLVFVLGLVVALSLIWNTSKVVQRNYNLQKQVDTLNDQIAILQLENEQLGYDIEYYKTPEYLELAAREKFNKKAPGEHVVALRENAISPSANDNSSETTQKTTKTPKPQYQENLEEWLYFLFGREPS